MPLNIARLYEEDTDYSDFPIVNLLGKGSFSNVYLVQNPSNKQYYAMKSIRKEEEYKENIEIEK